MHEVIMCFIAAIAFLLLILQFAENVALCFSDEEIRQIKAEINKYKSAIKRFINHIYKFLKG